MTDLYPEDEIRRRLEAMSPEQRAEAEKLLADYKREREDNPLLRYRPHPGQAAYHAIATNIGAVFAGNRFGKTAVGLVDDLIQVCDREAVPEHLRQFKRWDPAEHGPIRGRIAAPKFNENIEQVVFPELKKWVPRHQLAGGGWDEAFSKQKRVLRFANGSTIQFLTFDQDVDAHAGAALHFSHFDEEPEGEKGKLLWEENMTRLADYNGDFRLTMTPLFGLCVDTETECLTKRGWKRWDELREGEPVLTYNLADEVTEWAPLNGVYRDADYAGPMVRQEGRKRVDAWFTPDHKWVTKRGLVPWKDLTTKDKVILAAPHRNLNVDFLPYDALELAGWVLSEGWVCPTDNKVVIYQSATRYPEHCARIEELLSRVGAQYHTADRTYEHSKGEGIIRRYVVTGEFARWVRHILGAPKRLRPELVASLGEPGAWALLKGLLDGDGHQLDNGTWHFTSVDRGLADAVSMLGLLAGERVRISTFETSGGATVHRVHTQATGHTLGGFKKRCVEAPSPVDGVWCPMTPNRTFVARRNGKVYITGNSWSYKEIWKRRNTDPDITALQGDSAQNPHVNQKRLAKDAARMSKEEREARRQGKFVHFAGQFYPEYGEAHLVDALAQKVGRDGRPQVPEQIADQYVIVGIDPGLNFTGVVWVAFDNDNVALVFDVLKTEQMVVSDVAPKILERNRLWGIDPGYYVIDPSARNRSKTDAERLESHYLRAGIPTIRGQNDRAAGILEVKARLQHEGLYVTRDCAALDDEFENYRRDDKSADEFAAIKENDHLLDALRYVCMERLWTTEGEPVDDTPEVWQPGTAPPAEWLDAESESTHPLGAMV